MMHHPSLWAMTVTEYTKGKVDNGLESHFIAMRTLYPL